MKFEAEFDLFSHYRLNNLPNPIQWQTRCNYPADRTAFVWVGSSTIAELMSLELLDEGKAGGVRQRDGFEPTPKLFIMVPSGFSNLPDWCQVTVIYDRADGGSYTWGQLELDCECPPYDPHCPLIITETADGWRVCVEEEVEDVSGNGLPQRQGWAAILRTVGLGHAASIVMPA